jgi:hypothetical protein
MRSRAALWLPSLMLPSLLVLAAAGRGWSQDVASQRESTFLAGLRERQLYALAENYCADRLKRTGLPERERTELLVEWIRTLATHAVNAPPAEREAIWQKARAVAADELRQSPASPRLLLVRFQDALTPLACGELGRQEFEAGALAADNLDPTRGALAEAARSLERLGEELVREIPLRRRATGLRADELTAEELVALANHAQHQLARALKNQALLYPAGGNDRLALLLAAEQTLDRVRTQLSDENPLLRQMQLDLAESLRLLGRFDQASELLTPLGAEGNEPAVRLRAQAEQIRLAMARDDQSAVQQTLAAGRTIADQTSADLDFATFEGLIYLARQQAVANPAEAKRYQELAAEAARFLEAAHGPFWGRRADQVLLASLPRGAGAVNVELLARTGDSLYLKGDFAQAIAAYDDAAEQARAAGNVQAAFELGYKAGLVEQKNERHAEASGRFRRLAKNLATHPSAAQAHLTAAWHAAQQARVSPEAAGDYEAILQEHLSLWPTAASADLARLWLGKLAEIRSDWPAAIEAYAGVGRSSEHFGAAIEGLTTAWNLRLQQRAAAADDEVRLLAEQAARQLQQAILSTEGTLPESWTPADRAAALGAATIILAYLPSRAADAEGILRTALSAAPVPPDDWKQSAVAGLIVALAVQDGRSAEALALLSEQKQAAPHQLLELLSSLQSAAKLLPRESRTKVAAVEMAAVEQLGPRREMLSAVDQRRFDQFAAAALAAAGRRTEALAAYAELVRSAPNDAENEMAYAELLLDGADRESLAAALDQWRIIAGRSRSRTDSWYRAKLAVATAQFKLGDKQGAAKLVRYILLTPPGLKGTSWEEPFRKLLAQCEM